MSSETGVSRGAETDTGVAAASAVTLTEDPASCFVRVKWDADVLSPRNAFLVVAKGRVQGGPEGG